MFIVPNFSFETTRLAIWNFFKISDGQGLTTFFISEEGRTEISLTSNTMHCQILTL
jgi:hypothetical protein